MPHGIVVVYDLRQCDIVVMSKCHISMHLKTLKNIMLLKIVEKSKNFQKQREFVFQNTTSFSSTFSLLKLKLFLLFSLGKKQEKNIINYKIKQIHF